jgi:probable DNA metabolism protein
MTTDLLYDGSFDGFLTSIFECYDRKLGDLSIVRRNRYQPGIASSALEVETDIVKSQRVWSSLKSKLSVSKRNEFYKAFLSELPEIERQLLEFTKYVFASNYNIEHDLGHPSVIAITKIAHQVHREKHRMEAFIRFQRMKDDLYYASVSPDFNVLPLIASHFKDRYADQNWLIFDNLRKYGINYDCSSSALTEVLISFDIDANVNFLPEHMCHEDEVPYQKLWKEYFDSVNIGARKNKKLHVRHVPTRYWRFLTEKKEW